MLRSRIETTHPMVGGIRGSHIVLPRFAGAPDAAVYTEAVDKRPIFVIPWNEQILVGTTEVADQGDPGKVQPSQEEIDYLVRSFVHLFPQVKLSAAISVTPSPEFGLSLFRPRKRLRR